MSERLFGLDRVKGAAILLVVIGHVWRGLNTAGLIPDAALFARIDSVIYLFHMPVFFFLSGLFFSARRPFRDFLRNRALLLLWPMILWGWIDAGLKSAAGVPIKGHVYSATEVALSVLPPVGIFWFLYTLFILHLMAWALLRLPRGLALAAMAVLALAAMAGWINVSPFDSLWNTVIHMPPFFAGVAVALLAGRGVLLRGVWLWPGLAAFALGQVLVWQGWTMGGPLLAPVAMAFATLGFVLVCANLPLPARLASGLAALGQLTMPIYLTHVIFSAVTRLVLLRLGVEGVALHMGLGTVLGLLGPLALVWAAQRAGISVLIGFEGPGQTAKPRAPRMA